jgi:hypothetical protein
MSRPLLQSALPVVLLAACVAPSASASTISFSGNLRTDANLTACGSGCTLGPSNTDADYAQYAAVVDTFSVASTTSVYALTFSYGGGTNGAGAAIPQGGLEPYLSLFDSGGSFLASTFFGTTCPSGAQTNSVSGQCYDVELNPITLGPGSYSIALSAFENMSFAENLGTGTLADGFTGLGNLAGGEDLNYAFDVVLGSSTPTPTPEPTTAILFASGFLTLVLLVLRSRFTSHSNRPAST